MEVPEEDSVFHATNDPAGVEAAQTDDGVTAQGTPESQVSGPAFPALRAGRCAGQAAPFEGALSCMRCLCVKVDINVAIPTRLFQAVELRYTMNPIFANAADN